MGSNTTIRFSRLQNNVHENFHINTYRYRKHKRIYDIFTIIATYYMKQKFKPNKIKSIRLEYITLT